MNLARTPLYLAPLLSLCACAPAPVQWRGLDVSAGTMRVIKPQPTVDVRLGGTYYSPQLGSLTLLQDDRSVTGQYRFTRGAARVTGELSGTLEGNLLRFHWSERHETTRYAVRKSGRGTLFYDPPLDAQMQPRLFGHRHYTLRLGPVQKNFKQVLRTDGGPLTAVMLSHH